MKKAFKALLGVLIGFTNIVAGSCGGIVAVEALKKEGIEQTKAHATAIAVILPLTFVSAVMYTVRGNVRISDSLVYLLPGLAGAAAGSFLLPKIPRNILGKAFSLFIIYAGVRMILK